MTAESDRKLDFGQVLEEELKAIDLRRERALADKGPADSATARQAAEEAAEAAKTAAEAAKTAAEAAKTAANAAGEARRAAAEAASAAATASASATDAATAADAAEKAAANAAGEARRAAAESDETAGAARETAVNAVADAAAARKVAADAKAAATAAAKAAEDAAKSAAPKVAAEAAKKAAEAVTKANKEAKEAIESRDSARGTAKKMVKSAREKAKIINAKVAEAAQAAKAAKAAAGDAKAAEKAAKAAEKVAKTANAPRQVTAAAVAADAAAEAAEAAADAAKAAAIAARKADDDLQAVAAAPDAARKVDNLQAAADPDAAAPAGKWAEVDQRLKVARKQALRKHLVGLAFSGGGIRSATFAVGILQGLAKLGLMRRIDYLSTVSGGGYAGSWLAAWIKRDGSVANVEKQLARSRVENSNADRGGLLARKGVLDEEPEPIYHLRANSRFLAPRSGFLTSDIWSIIATYVRNVTINLLMLLPAAMIIVLLVRGLVWVFRIAVPTTRPFNPSGLVLALPMGWIGGVSLYRGLRENRTAVVDLRRDAVRPQSSPPPVTKPIMLCKIAIPIVVGVVCFPLALMTVWSLVFGLWNDSPWPWVLEARHRVTFYFGSLKGLATIAWSVVGLAGLLIVAVQRRSTRRVGGERDLWGQLTFAILIPLALGLIYERFDESRLASIRVGTLDLSKYIVFPLALGYFVWRAAHEETAEADTEWGRKIRRAAARSGVAGGFLLAAAVSALSWLSQYGPDSEGLIHYRPDLLATFAPPACLLVIVATTIFHVAQHHHDINEDEREWWAYFDAYLIILALVWLVAFGTILYLPAAISYIQNAYVRTGVLAGLISTWVGTTIAGILAGSSKRTGRGGGSVSLETIAALAPPVFLVGLFGLLGALASWLVDAPPSPATAPVPTASLGVYYRPPGAEPVQIELASPPQAKPQDGVISQYVEGMNRAAVYQIVLAMLVLGLISYHVSKVVDVNLFSLNAMYANRLVRCYLGASRMMPRWERRWTEGDRREGGGAPTNVNGQPRRANPVTGFDLRDDLSLAAFQIGKGVGRYHGPQLLINTSLNLVASEDLALSDRKSESFVLSPSHCGSKGTGYARVNAVGDDTVRIDKDLTLGRAIAVSGAAVDPNMNFHQSSALSAFLTIFNARLGYWIENPRPFEPKEEKSYAWTGKSPQFSGLLYSELLGDTDNKKEFVHLSDGGHFENTGAYELVRRRCRYIVAVDANEDRTAADENLANLVRLVRIDFGIRIQLDTTPLKLDGDDTKLSRSHVIIGSVRYDDVDNGQVPGVLVYIRTSMTGDEPADILNYASVNKQFPYTTSANQFFDESQFESYRALGDHVARVVFEDAKADAERLKEFWKEQDPDKEFRDGNKRLFAALRRRWAESMPGRDTQFLDSARGYVEVQDRLRTNPSLMALSLQVYPELGSAAGAAGAPRAELYAVAQMLQAMENAWVGLDLKSHPEAPISHGWWSVFRRWTATKAFHDNWPILRPEFSTEFVRFVETRLGLVPAMPEVVPWGDETITEAERNALIAEFDREWPKAVEDARSGELVKDMRQMIADAEELGNSEEPAWAIVQKSKPPAAGARIVSELRGIVLLFRGSPLHQETQGVSDYELLIWVRRSHRGIGLATCAMEQKVMEMLQSMSNKGRAVYVRYPRVEDDVVQSMWKRFFALYDFESQERDDASVHLLYKS
jgi:hypothetical protein